MAIWCHFSSSFALSFFIFNFLQCFYFLRILLTCMSCIVFLYFLYVCITVLPFWRHKGIIISSLFDDLVGHRSNCISPMHRHYKFPRETSSADALNRMGRKIWHILPFISEILRDRAVLLWNTSNKT